MLSHDLKKSKLPDAPGVYMFMGSGGKILYVGKATSLRSRVRSYFANDLLHTRGKHIVDMVTMAKSVRFETSDSVLEALILEASLIKKHQPIYNTREKDDKSWNYVVITKEEYPRVLLLRERELSLADTNGNGEYKYRFGPFIEGGSLREALVIVRKIFPFRDNCIPNSGKPCFNRQIGLCPGVCTGEISRDAYKERIHEIRLFFEGKKAKLVRRLKALMNEHAKAMEFEEAAEYKRMIFALTHIKDVSLIKEEMRNVSLRSAGIRRRAFRVEAYDIAHISGKYTVGVMTVVEDNFPKRSDYRKFKIRIATERSDDPEAKFDYKFATGQARSEINDPKHLEQILRRRFNHPEWRMPDLLVVDGGLAQKRRAEKVLAVLEKAIPVVSVLKDERHKPKKILGDQELALSYERAILIANGEAHRFAVAYHRTLRERLR